MPAGAFRLFHRVCATVLPAYLARLRSSNLPVVIGPWTSEVGHELLYWIPFLETLRAHGVIDPRRAYAVSRGGNASWYGNIADHYYNVFWDLDPHDYRQQVSNERDGNLEKRLIIDRVDRQVLHRAVEHFGLDRYHVLHPMIMNILLMPVWKGRLPTELESKYLTFRPFVDEPIDLEKAGIFLDDSRECVAVKFHFNYWNFRPDPKNIERVNRLVDVLTDRYNVLLLQLSSSIDNHEFPAIAGRRHVIDCSTMPIADNLRVQTSLIRRAKYSVTALSGFSLLPAFVGRKSISFYSESYNNTHFETARRLYDALSPGGWEVRDINAPDFCDLP